MTTLGRWRSQLREALAGWPAWRIALGVLASLCAVWGVVGCIVVGWLAVLGVVHVPIAGIVLAAAALWLLGLVFGVASRWVDQDEDGNIHWFEPPAH